MRVRILTFVEARDSVLSLSGSGYRTIGKSRAKVPQAFGSSFLRGLTIAPFGHLFRQDDENSSATREVAAHIVASAREYLARAEQMSLRFVEKIIAQREPILGFS